MKLILSVGTMTTFSKSLNLSSSRRGGLSNLTKSLLLDEVHLLHEERGAVIETIVARTQRQVETTQTMIRIVGLSATLPNYLDVAMFLNVRHRILMPSLTSLFHAPWKSAFMPSSIAHNNQS